jgi:exonuclease III
MNHNFLTWNVRGLNEGRKRLKIRNLLSKWKVDIVCLQETKLKLISFFFLISQNALKERKRGATHSTQGVYKGKPKEKKISERENPAN